MTEKSLTDYRFVFTSTAFDALREFNRGLFDAYILDYWLPDLRGVQLCREIRKVDPCAHVLFFSEVSSEQEELRALRAGASACLCDPVDAPALKRHLRVLREIAGLHEPSATVQAQLALSDELTERVAELLRRTGKAPEAAMRSIERTAKHKAFRAFVQRGGTLASFERAWPAMFGDAWRSKEWRPYTFV
jgi:CheY-like chemotaxis protein